MKNESQDFLAISDLDGLRCVLYRRAKKQVSGISNKIENNDYGWWELPANRAKTVEYLVVIENNTVTEVRLVEEWAESQSKPGRLRCLSKPTDNLEHILGKNVSGIYNARDRTILRFINC